MNKKKRFTALISAFALSLGSIAGFAQYWPDILELAFADPDKSGWSNAAVDEQVYRDSANIEQILALDPPEPDAPAEKWMAFVNTMESIEMGDRHGNSGVTTPLLVFYAYIAKHHPATIYQLVEEHHFSDRKFSHLVTMGFLEDWPKHVSKSDRLLLESNSALIHRAFTKGEKYARQSVTEAFFRLAEANKGAGQPDLDLSNLRYGMMAMSAEERRQAVSILLDQAFDIDPRGVEDLVSVEGLNPDRLLSLIRLYAYDSKSMSSYMLTGAQLGETGYIRAMIPDIPDNAEQPTNFYCALCGLVIYTDGMLGPPLIKAARDGTVEVNKVSRGEFVLQREGGY